MKKRCSYRLQLISEGISHSFRFNDYKASLQFFAQVFTTMPTGQRASGLARCLSSNRFEK